MWYDTREDRQGVNPMIPGHLGDRKSVFSSTRPFILGPGAPNYTSQVTDENDGAL